MIWELHEYPCLLSEHLVIQILKEQKAIYQYIVCHSWSMPMKTSRSHLIWILNSFGIIRSKFSHTCGLTEILKLSRTSLVAQWIRIRLPMQGTQVRSLVQEDPTCRGATKPECHNFWACALEPASHNYWVHVLQLLKPACLEPVLRDKRSHCSEKPAHHNEE